MSTAELKELVASLVLSQKATDRQMKETDLLMKENALAQKATERQLKELGKQIGGQGNKFGSFAEGLSFRSIQRILREKFGMDDMVAATMKTRLEGWEEEYDLLAYSTDGTNKAVVVEIKSKLRPEDIVQMKRKMDNVFKMMPQHRDKTFQGMVACVSGSSDLKRQVLANGWHLAHIGDDLFELENPSDFVPRIYTA